MHAAMLPPAASSASTSAFVETSPFLFEPSEQEDLSSAYEAALQRPGRFTFGGSADDVAHHSAASSLAAQHLSPTLMPNLATAGWPRSSAQPHHQAHHLGQGMHTSYNTRPMTAPSSVTSPYYQPGYSPDLAYHPGGVLPQRPSANGHATGTYTGNPFGVVGAAPTDWSAPSTSPVEPVRGRNWSLPDITAVGLPDEPSHGNSASPFFYSPPPAHSHLQQQQQHQGGLSPAELHAMPLSNWQSRERPATASHAMRHASNASSRPSTGISERPDTASSSTSTLYGGGGRTDEGDDGEGEEDVKGMWNSRARTSSGTMHGSVSTPHKKRPRRRFEEIDRMYGCSYPGCTKAYGTLNHLNAHVTMQRHGPKRLPGEFKELRKAWRDRKKAEEAKRAEEDADRGSRTPSPQHQRQWVGYEPERHAFPAAEEQQQQQYTRLIHPSIPPVLPNHHNAWSQPAFPPSSVAAASYPNPITALLPSYQYAPRMQLPHNGTRPQTAAPTSIHFPMPMRPQTAPSSEGHGGAYGFLHQDLSPPRVSSRHPQTTTYRSDSLPALDEAADDADGLFAFAPPPSSTTELGAM